METSSHPSSLADFVSYAQTLAGDEKGEAQVFCDRLFKAFGYDGYREAGATLEFRVPRHGRAIRFSDLVWKPRLVMEMKSRGQDLRRHYHQLFDYWIDLVPHRPRYAILCNFDDFWIYDFDQQMEEPMDRIPIQDLVTRREAFNFFLPKERPPWFGNNRIDVTRKAADKLVQVFQALVHRNVERQRAQRFLLQCLVAVFSEDVDLLPRGLFEELLDACEGGESSYDLMGALFRQMNNPAGARGGRYRDVPYFNGGLFSTIDPVELNSGDILQLRYASTENWASVQPAIFGTLFQDSTDKRERHALGAHFTSEADIYKVVRPTILEPFRRKIEGARTFQELLRARQDLANFRVLDPACGSGNFLYVAYREMRRLETNILIRLFTDFARQAEGRVATRSVISTKQFFGIDKFPFAVELAKVTLTLARELAIIELRETGARQHDLPGTEEPALPLDNLDDNIVCADALFAAWPEADAIIGNPPFQSKNKMQREFGRAYLNQLRATYPDIPGRADYCVYWFYKAHNSLKPGKRAGLVGTNTIRQNYSREGGLDHIVATGGTITEAVSTQVWSGDAAVHVSIVNWIKGVENGAKKIYTQLGDQPDSPWTIHEVPFINSALTSLTDVTLAVSLRANRESGICFQGQTHGHEGFLLERRQAEASIAKEPALAEVLFPLLIAEELLGTVDSQPERYVIDFHPRDVTQAAQYGRVFKIVSTKVLPTRVAAASEEEERSKEALRANTKAKVNRHHSNFLKRWWLLSYPREELINRIAELPRYAVCGRVTKRPIFEFIHTSIRPNDALVVFTVSDDYSFGILQSSMHWEWFKARCSTLEERFRYTSDTVFDSFPWPQQPTAAAIRAVAAAAVQLRSLRRSVMHQNGWSLRDLYRTLELPGENPIRDAHSSLDEAVRNAYGMKPKDEPLAFLLNLDRECAARESEGKPVVAPGCPPSLGDPGSITTTDCVRLT
ncbi:MAG: class I SAM-dependent DNA methyltransferase [Bryobacteraceae bacterium]|jgi:SAM-dependent methyltransferase